LNIFKIDLENDDYEYFDVESTVYQLKRCTEDLNLIEKSGKFDRALDLIEFNTKSSSDKGLFGKYAFAANRSNKDGGIARVPFEKNTKIEQQVYIALINHFRGKPLSKGNANTIHKLLLTNQYSDIFNEPEKGVIYRGMTVTEKWISKLIDVNSSKMTIEKEFTFEPKQGASSWTVSKNIATKFALKNVIDKKTYAIILIANVEDNKKQLLSSDKGLYYVEPLNGYQNENEVIGLGSIKISGIKII
jgi:hypothetical protein